MVDPTERFPEPQDIDFQEGIPLRAPVDPELRDALLRICLQPMVPGLGIGGSKRTSYFDIDYLGSLGFSDVAGNGMELIDSLVTTLASAVSDVEDARRVDGLAFLRRTSGPAGLVAVRASLSEKTGLPSVIINPHRRLLLGQIKPLPTRDDLKIALIMDTTTDGTEVIDVLQTLWRAKFRVVHRVISLFDTDEGAREHLAQCDVPLTVLMSPEDVLAGNQVGDNV